MRIMLDKVGQLENAASLPPYSGRQGDGLLLRLFLNQLASCCLGADNIYALGKVLRIYALT